MFNKKAMGPKCHLLRKHCYLPGLVSATQRPEEHVPSYARAMWQLAIPGLNSYRCQVANHSLGTHLVATDTPRATPRWTAQVRALRLLTVQISTTAQWPSYPPSSPGQKPWDPPRGAGCTVVDRQDNSSLRRCGKPGPNGSWREDREQKRRQGWCR